MYLTHGFFESQRVNVSSHTSKSIPSGVCKRREYVLQTVRGGTRVLCQERATALESKPETLLLLFSFRLFFFVKTDFLGNKLENIERMVFT